jgi:hypothetical protein
MQNKKAPGRDMNPVDRQEQIALTIAPFGQFVSDKFGYDLSGRAALECHIVRSTTRSPDSVRQLSDEDVRLVLRPEWLEFVSSLDDNDRMMVEAWLDPGWAIEKPSA